MYERMLRALDLMQSNSDSYYLETEVRTIRRTKTNNDYKLKLRSILNRLSTCSSSKQSKVIDDLMLNKVNRMAFEDRKLANERRKENLRSKLLNRLSRA